MLFKMKKNPCSPVVPKIFYRTCALVRTGHCKIPQNTYNKHYTILVMHELI